VPQPLAPPLLGAASGACRVTPGRMAGSPAVLPMLLLRVLLAAAAAAAADLVASCGLRSFTMTRPGAYLAAA
jgi:hypothetical protein